ncbi:MAG: hypothetical protein M3O36_14905 [Myxococcota bacterium]|nr:hypothetical protein [Myxococcota bacterium]
MNPCRLRADVDRHFAGKLSPRGERAMREHLPTCASCNRHYGRHLMLSSLDPTALPSEERIARGLGLWRWQLTRVPVLAAPIVLAAAAIVLFVHTRSPTAAFQARGEVKEPPASRIVVYEVPPEGKPSLARESLGSRDALAFAYENGGGKKRLMVFGVDEHGHVYWFYPSYAREDEDPQAIPIAADARRHELPDAVSHRFDGARLSVRAVFLDAPVSVHKIEALLESHPAGPLPLEGAIENDTSFRIVP